MALDFGKLAFSTSFNPTSAFPLDARCYFESLEAAELAASTAEEVGSSNTVYYYGETLVVVEDDVAKLYIITPDNTLEAVGSTVFGDDKSIVLENGILSLNEFGKHYYKYIAATETEPSHYERVEGFKAGLQAQVSVDAFDATKFILEWYEPNPTTVEGLDARLSGVEVRVESLEENKQNKLEAINGLMISDEDNTIGIDTEEIFILDGGAETWED